MPNSVRAVVFDLDGTLVETAADIHAVLSDVLAEAGLVGPDLPAVRGMIGDGAKVLIERALIAIGEPASPAGIDTLHDRFRERYAQVPCRFSVPYPGARELLAGLRRAGCRLGLCTNKPHVATLGLLQALALDTALDAVVGGDLLPGIRKPHPGHLADVLLRLDTPPEAAIMVGDSRTDLLTARALGVPCILVSFGYTSVPARQLGADHVIDHLADLPAAMARLRTLPAGP